MSHSQNHRTQSADAAEGPTALLRAVHRGDPGARETLFARLYEELKEVASFHLRSERPSTLSPTVLVHEAYLRLAQVEIRAEMHGELFSLIASVMRKVLVDAARKRSALKRTMPEPVDVRPPTSCPDEYLVRLDRAFERLEHEDRELADVLLLRFFGGYDVEDCAELLGVSTATVKRRCRYAKAWLHREIEGEDDEVQTLDPGRPGRGDRDAS